MRTFWCAAAALMLGGNTLLWAQVPLPSIHQAARDRDGERVATLLADHPDWLELRTADGETPLHFAAAGHDAGTLRVLLEHGGDSSARDALGRTALHYAATAWDPEVLQLLLAAGADVNATDDNGETPLHFAARRLNDASMQLLLAAGAAVNTRAAGGRTPLHVLGLSDRCHDRVDALYLPLAHMLIRAGADPNLVDDDGQRALTPPWEVEGDRSSYRTYPQITQLLQQWATTYPAIARVVNLGNSFQGRAIWALNISDNVGVAEDEPRFKYVSTMHGDEWTGNEMCLYLIEHLLSNYGADPRITNLINEIDIWIVPVMNPDGYVNTTRTNSQGIDLNRNFPEGFNGEPNTTAGRAVETGVIMNWTMAYPTTLSANLHTGALVVNYPYDNDGKGSVYSASPDDDVFIYLSEEYARNNPPMWASSSFFHGITNGAAWYSITGGMQDWHYRYLGGFEVTIELSSVKRPTASLLPQYWLENRESMLRYMELSLIGVRGIVTAANTGAPLAATIAVVGRNRPVFTDPVVGNYHRLLLPGQYTLRFSAPGYDTLFLPVTVDAGPAKRLDVALAPEPAFSAPMANDELPVDRPTQIAWTGNSAAAFELQHSTNYGDMQAMTDGFEGTTLDPAYTTGGNLPWTIVTGNYYAGTQSARAGAITHSQVSWMQRTVGAGALSFRYRVSSESGYDYFNFYINSQRMVRVSGNGSWQLFQTVLPPGNHLLRWEYTKDVSVSSYSDTVFIDELSLINDSTVWSPLAGPTEVGADNWTWTPTELSNANRLRIRSVTPSGTGDWVESGTFAVVAAPYAAGDMNCDGAVNFGDISLFIAALKAGSPDGWPHDCPWSQADCNGDGAVNFGDIGAFIAAVKGTP